MCIFVCVYIYICFSQTFGSHLSSFFCASNCAQMIANHQQMTTNHQQETKNHYQTI